MGGTFPLRPEGKDNIGSVRFLLLWVILGLFSPWTGGAQSGDHLMGSGGLAMLIDFL